MKVCCVCGEKFSSHFEGKPYCNKHYLRMYHHGTTEKAPKKTKNSHVSVEGCVELSTTKGVKFIVDAIDFDKVKSYTWCLSKTGYLVANIDGKVIKLHRHLLQPNETLIIDHVDGDKTNNRRSNLRICTRSENSRNCKLSKNNSSGYTGISMTKDGRYRVRIMFNRREIYLGKHRTFAEALKARRAAEERYYQEFAPSHGALSNHLRSLEVAI